MKDDEIDEMQAHVETFVAEHDGVEFDGPRADWAAPDRELLKPLLSPPPAFPIQHLRDWGSWAAKFARSVSAPVDYVVAGLLACAGSLIGAARQVSPWDGWKEYPAVWTLMIGNPSAGKTPVFGPFEDVMQLLEKEAQGDFPAQQREYDTRRQVADSMREAWKSAVKVARQQNKTAPLRPEEADEPRAPKPPRLVVSDTTIEALGILFENNPRGLLLARDELSAWLGNMDKYGGDGNIAFFLERFSGGRVQVDRVAEGRTLTAERGLLSIFGGIQPDRFSELLLRRADDGLISRFLVFYPDPVARVVPEERADLSRLEIRLRRLRDLRGRPTEEGMDRPISLPLSSTAREYFEPWWKANGIEAAEARALHAGFLGKGPGLVLRLACILEHLHWADHPANAEPHEIGTAAMQAAIALWNDYFVPMFSRVLGDRSRPWYVLHAMRLLRELKAMKQPRMNVRELKRARIAGLDEAGMVELACAFLEHRGWIRPIGGREGGTKGRQRRDYEVNPILWRAVVGPQMAERVDDAALTEPDQQT